MSTEPITQPPASPPLPAPTGSASVLLCRLTPDTAKAMVKNTNLPMRIHDQAGKRNLGRITKLRMDKDGNVYARIKFNAAGKALLTPNGPDQRPRAAGAQHDTKPPSRGSLRRDG